ncbi:NACHT domain-containing protein [Streptomyces sp. NPDC056411]|uniref:NACHT domain-containing protein n=1 Tax=Streptomyces sp. NPDC056411 TaxID=3345813 RepID=UPI0035D932A2
MRWPSPVTRALGARVSVVPVLLAASGAGVAGAAALAPTGAFAPWAGAMLLGPAAVGLGFQVRRLRSAGRARREGPTHPPGSPAHHPGSPPHHPGSQPHHSGGQDIPEGPVRNTVGGSTVYGSVLQAQTINGPVTIGEPRRPSSETPLDHDADLLAKALRKQWREEEEHRKIRDPIPLPVRWQAAPDEVLDHWSNICRSPAGVVAPGRPDLAGQLDEIVALYRRIPSRRLVVLGRAGSGKTILTIRFVLDLLAARTAPADRVPVIFGLASWNPARTPLRHWLTAELERNHPRLAEKRGHAGLADSGPGAPTRAAALVDNDRILPVLDGFDEIADGLRRPALEALNATDMPLLLTSRCAEYAAAVRRTKALTAAAAVELSDLSLTDLSHYLPRTTRKATPTSTAWDPVLDHLRDRPQHPASIRLATVLRTPLMVALARTIYSDDPDRDPWTLLDTGEFRTPDALEDHLLDNFIPTVYRDRAADHRARVPHWLGHLARHLDRLGTPNLAWWQLGSTLRRSSRMGLIGLTTGLAFGLVDTLVMWYVVCYLGYGVLPGLVNGLLNGVSFGATSGLVFGLVYGLRNRKGAREPSRVRVRLRGGRKGMRREFLPRLAIGLVGGFGFGFLSWLVDTLVIGLTDPHAYGLVLLLAHGADMGLQAGVLYGLAAGLTFALSAALEGPIDLGTAVGPLDLVRTNRALVLFHLLVFGLVLGIAGGALYGLHKFRGIDWLAFGLVGWLGGGLAYGLGLTAWGQWLTLARLWLPLTGRLPWAVNAFLRDAHRRGVLRQAGAVYQFRHARLQERLAHTSRTPRCGDADPAPEPRAPDHEPRRS